VGINRLSIESINALDDLGANPWRERRFGAHLDKARSSKHLRRRSIVTGHATIKWSRRLDRKERAEGPRREPLKLPIVPTNSPSSSIASSMFEGSLRTRS
jgi:hypothetical protein